MSIALAAPFAALLSLGAVADPHFVLQGRVLDPTRAPIATARVTAINNDDGTAQPATSTDEARSRAAPARRPSAYHGEVAPARDGAAGR